MYGHDLSVHCLKIHIDIRVDICDRWLNIFFKGFNTIHPIDSFVIMFAIGVKRCV